MDVSKTDVYLDAFRVYVAATQEAQGLAEYLIRTAAIQDRSAQ